MFALCFLSRLYLKETLNLFLARETSFGLQSKKKKHEKVSICLPKITFISIALFLCSLELSASDEQTWKFHQNLKWTFEPAMLKINETGLSSLADAINDIMPVGRDCFAEWFWVGRIALHHQTHCS